MFNAKDLKTTLTTFHFKMTNIGLVQYRTVLIIFLRTLQTIIIAQMLSIGDEQISAFAT